MKPTSVLYVIPSKGRESSFVFSTRESEAISEQGVKVEIHRIDTTLSPGSLLREHSSLKRKIRAFKPQLIHVQYGTLSAFVTAVAAGKVPFVISFRGSDLNSDSGVWWLRSSVARSLSQFAAWRSRFNICVSRGLQQRLIVGRSRSIVLPTGVDSRLFLPMDRDEARRQLGWDPQSRVILFNLSSSRRLKRLDLAEQAVELLNLQNFQAELRVLKDIEPKRVPLYMNAADCLLLTSDSEGSPTVVQEALCCNLPIVSVDVGDVRERVSGVEHCHIVERTPESIAGGLRRVLTEPVRSNGVIKRDEISLQNLSARIMQVYETVLAPR